MILPRNPGRNPMAGEDFLVASYMQMLPQLVKGHTRPTWKGIQNRDRAIFEEYIYIQYVVYIKYNYRFLF